MPRKRRVPKRRQELPTALDAISLCERTLWNTSGPILEGDVDGELDDPSMYVIWPDWPTWFTFYASIREELLGERNPRQRPSIGEAIYLAILHGEDPEETLARLIARVKDPRTCLLP